MLFRAISFAALMLGCAALAPAETERMPLGLSLTITNDNTPYLRVEPDHRIAFGFGRGPDNTFTVGLRLEARWDAPVLAFDRIFGFAFLNVYTNLDRTVSNDNGWRTDFLSNMVWGEKDFDALRLACGIGTVARGNFSGSYLQNSAHLFVGATGYGMGYRDRADDAFGPLLGLAAVLEPWKLSIGEFGISPYVESTAQLDPLGVARSNVFAILGLKASTGAITARIEGGYRGTAIGDKAFLADLYSSGPFIFSGIVLRLGEFLLDFSFALNPYGNAASPELAFWDVQNQQYSWTIGYRPDGRGDPGFLAYFQ